MKKRKLFEELSQGLEEIICYKKEELPLKTSTLIPRPQTTLAKMEN